MNWIKTSERTPEKSGEYLITNMRTVFMATYRQETKKWSVDEDGWIWEPYAEYWMPLPEPPNQ